MYASDITRTVPVSGHFSARQREIYNIVLGAQQAAIDAFVAGKSTINDRDRGAGDVYADGEEESLSAGEVQLAEGTAALVSKWCYRL